MGKWQQCRARALSVRGALALGGVVVVAASMTQVAGTMAAPDAVRTAKLGTATENYFPTPLTSSVTCTTDPDGATLTARRARIDWAPVSEATGYLVVFINRDNGSVYRTDDVPAGQTRISGVSATSPRTGLYVRVYTKNGPATSSGYSVASRGMSFKDWVSNRTECEGPGGTAQANQPWENQSAWDPAMQPFAVDPGASMFRTLMDTLNSEEALGPLPEEAELADLEAAASAGATPTGEASPTESTANPTTPSPSAPSVEAETTTVPGGGVPGATGLSSSSSSAPATRIPATSGTTRAAATATSSQSVAPTTLATASTSTAPATNQATTPATTVATSPLTASTLVGGDPIAVGTGFARLDPVEGQPRLVITTGGGAEVCSADLPGASRITAGPSGLTVTVDGRVRGVDPATCQLD